MINIEVRDGELFRGDTATLLVELFRRCIQPQKRTVACVAPGAPADFADAVTDVFALSHVATVAMASDVSDEKIGEEFSTRPFLY